MVISAEFTVNGSPNPAAHSVSYGATISLALVNIGNANSIVWTIDSISQPGDVKPTITAAGSPVGSTASFVMPSNPGDGAGRTVLVKCMVTGAGQQSTTSYGVVGVPNSAGIVPLTPGEQLARDATHGWIPELNAALNGVAPGTATTGPSLVAAKAAATSNVALSGTGTFDGIALVATDRIFLAFQSAPAQNGPWLVAAGAWARPTDFNADADVISGQTIVVTQGTLYGHTQWALTSSGPFTLGTTALSWSQIGGSATSGSGVAKESVTVIADSGITLSGLAQTIDGVAINSTSMRVLVAAQSLGATNGIYTPASGAWTRCADFDSSGDVLLGCGGKILQGTTYAGGEWSLATTGTIILGTTALSFRVERFLQGTLVNDVPTWDGTRFIMAQPSAGATRASVLISTNLAHSGTLTYDDVALVADDIVLDIANTTAATRGLWTIAAGAWTRPAVTHAPGMKVEVTRGTYGTGTSWQMSAAVPFTVGVTAQTWARADGAAQTGTTTTVAVTTVTIKTIGLPRSSTFLVGGSVMARSSPTVRTARWTQSGTVDSAGVVTLNTPSVEYLDGYELGTLTFSSGTATLLVQVTPASTASTVWTPFAQTLTVN